MGCGDRARDGIEEEYRQAVRGHNRKRKSSFAGNERVALRGTLSGILSPEDCGAVDLGNVNRICGKSESPHGNGAVLNNSLPVIADMEGKVEAFVAAGAHPA